MPESPASIHLPENYPVPVTAKNIAREPESHLRPGRPLQTRRLRKHSFPRPGTYRRADSSSSRGGRSGPATPLLRWKFEDTGYSGKPPHDAEGKTNQKSRNAWGRKEAIVSSRKLAAGIWHLQLMEVTGSRGGARETTGIPLGFEHVHGDLPPAHACKYSKNLHFETKNGFSSSVPLHKFASPMLPNHAMERATKWDAGCPRNADEVFKIYSHLKFLDGRHVSTASIISSLEAELYKAQTRICELEAERKSVKNKLDHFLRKLVEEKASWRRREHEKVRAIIDGVKDDLSRERRNRRRCEIVNSKLMNELAEAKLSAKRLLQDYEKERKARELMEDVCDELEKEIGEDKDEVEVLKRDSLKIQEEVEEERRMLQIAEVWREERVQMKLLDAKLALEEKHTNLTILQAELEAFLRAWKGSPNRAEVRRAELLKEAVDLAKNKEMNEFAYQPPRASEDIFASFEELQPKEEAREKAIEPCYAYSPASIHSASPATDAFLEKPSGRYCNRDTEDDSDWETLSPREELESSNSRGISEPSVNAMCEESSTSVSGMDGGNADNCEANSKSSGAYSLVAKYPRKKGVSITRLWRSSGPNNGEIQRKNSAEYLNGKVSDARFLNPDPSPDHGLAGDGLIPVDQWTSPDSANPHIARGMKGCIEWPRGSHKQSLKSKLLEARLESHKTQLYHVLRQKI
ncbi:hypothetical protein KSP40_PGU015859 [Platanthera guangdongensis]|uniref:Uncharacterized protein n=1 Tax=Platanthera guangdongensis TaxID=2320717 RepID=A0ABR2N565_9ASPA